MLYDKAFLEVRAGAGGDGCLSFRREAHVPKGGPDGGDGGRGGDVILLCDDSMRDLQSYKHAPHVRAKRGGHGQGALKHGADGEDKIVRVPPGTVVVRWDGTRHDLVKPGQRVVVARGGVGGRGNKRFAGPTRQTPRLASKGLSGEEGRVELQLKLLADVGLVGVPNAGKSSLLSVLTRARPKVAPYPFTTLEPHLGTLVVDDRQLIIADIPGLIEGASDNAGLGHDFLAHVERTKLLVHVLDLAPLDGTDPLDNYEVIERELEAFNPRLASLPRVLALSKADLVTPEAAEEAAAFWRERFAEPREEWEEPAGTPVLVVSSATHQGIDALARELLRLVPEEAPVDELIGEGESDVAEYRVFRPGRRRTFEVEPTQGGGFRVVGETVDRLIARFDIENEEALEHIERRLRSMGVVDALQAAGFEPGDDVEIGGVLFEFDPDGGS